MGFLGGSVGKESACNTGDTGSIPGSGRSAGEVNGNPVQYSCLENHMDRGGWQAIVLKVPKSWTQLSTRARTHTSSLNFVGKVIEGVLIGSFKTF